MLYFLKLNPLKELQALEQFTTVVIYWRDKINYDIKNYIGQAKLNSIDVIFFKIPLMTNTVS